jgi:RimJ/RimL family protein N-acetyltransferase
MQQDNRQPACREMLVSEDRIFTPNYREEFPLPDGRRLRLRLGKPDDREMLLEAFGELSPESRYTRWGYAKTHLTDDEIERLATADGDNDLPLAAIELYPSGRERAGAGLARFVRDPDDPSTAEISLTVVDEWQGQGVGRLLLDRLLAAMAEAGVRRARGRMLAANEPMRRLIARYAEPGDFWSDGPATEFEFTVPALIDTPATLAARGARGLIRAGREAATRVISTPLRFAEDVLGRRIARKRQSAMHDRSAPREQRP